jgi:hypothetical protein
MLWKKNILQFNLNIVETITEENMDQWKIIGAYNVHRDTYKKL